MDNEITFYSLHYLNIICYFIENIFIPDIVKNKSKLIPLCSSINNSKGINQNIEDLFKSKINNYFNNHDIFNPKLYIGKPRADTSLEFDSCIIHIDNKGVEVTEEIKTKKEMINDLQLFLPENKFKSLDLNKQDKEVSKQLMIENNLNLMKYHESWKDHLDANVHFKNTQSNLCGFESVIEKKICYYDGKIPRFTDNKPHLTYIVKHIYNKLQGVIKIVIYSIPHVNLQEKYYKDIQCSLDNERKAKSKTEFRFNLNDKKDKPYKFKLNKNGEIKELKNMYKVFEI